MRFLLALFILLPVLGYAGDIRVKGIKGYGKSPCFSSLEPGELHPYLRAAYLDPDFKNFAERYSDLGPIKVTDTPGWRSEGPRFSLQNAFDLMSDGYVRAFLIRKADSSPEVIAGKVTHFSPSLGRGGFLGDANRFRACKAFVLQTDQGAREIDISSELVAYAYLPLHAQLKFDAIRTFIATYKDQKPIKIANDTRFVQERPALSIDQADRFVADGKMRAFLIQRDQDPPEVVIGRVVQFSPKLGWRGIFGDANQLKACKTLTLQTNQGNRKIDVSLELQVYTLGASGIQ